MKEAFCKHGEKDILRGCVKAINFCNTESRGELQDFAQNKLKELDDELIAKLKSAMREVAVCFYWTAMFLFLLFSSFGSILICFIIAEW